MILKRVEIENFRSIKGAKILFGESCYVLVGINESGKSNILKALEYLDVEKEISNLDIREPLPDEGFIKQSFVRFVFSLERVEVEQLVGLLAEKFVGLDVKDDKIIYSKKSKKKISLVEFVEENIEKVRGVYFLEPKVVTGSWNVNEQYDFDSSVLSATSAAIKITLKKDKSDAVVQKGLFVVSNSVANGDVPGLSAAQIAAFFTAYYSITSKFVAERLPEVIMWRYDDRYILPERVSLDGFIEDLNICIPLKNLFRIGGSKSPAEELRNLRDKPSNVLYNHLNRISLCATEYFKKIWPEYNINFTLRENSGYLYAEVQDSHNRYRFEQRSDGFKRFVAILLMISARRSSGELDGSVILMDEPDVSLHPSGIRYLRDELLSISKKSYVVVSTHSIFMIDPSCISRHLIISKEKEITKISVASESNYFDEEVLYNALGYSVFSVMKDSNIIFEGWRDKALFNIATALFPRGYKRKLAALAEIGTCHSKGVKSISHIASILELAARKYVILSDADGVAQEHQRQFVREMHAGSWFTYADLGANEITSEDFIASSYLVECAAEVLPVAQIKKFRLPKYGRIDYLRVELTKCGLSKNEVSSLLDTFKQRIIDGLTPKYIEESYYIILEALAGKMAF